MLPGEALGPGSVVSSNAHALAAMVRAAGGEPFVLPIARDDRAAIAATADSLAGMELLVTTGGASVGDHDLVQEALACRGFVLDIWQVAMRPGKPLLFGQLGATPVLGLPGNPVSAFVCAVLFMLPALARLGGLTHDLIPVTRAVLGADVAANDVRADHLRATLALDAAGTVMVTPFIAQDSSMLRLLSQAHALVLRPPNAPALLAGAEVPIIRLDAWGL